MYNILKKILFLFIINITFLISCDSKRDITEDIFIFQKKIPQKN